MRGCVRTERNKGCPHLKKRSGPDGPSIPHVMSGPVQKSQYPSQERAVIGGAAPQKSLILTENGPFPQNFGACGGLGAGAPRQRHTSPAAARPSETGVVQPPRSDRENLLVGGLVATRHASTSSRGTKGYPGSQEYPLVTRETQSLTRSNLHAKALHARLVRVGRPCRGGS